MKEALRLAAKGKGHTSPNPMVGAVVVQGDTVIGRGWHEFVGGPHAEVNALRDAGPRAKGAVLYVTLEPCNHQGRTPPCTKAVLEAGISRVVIGMADPNPNVKGGGADFLRSRGIEIELGILENECRLLNQAFIKHSATGLPFVTLKAAATLDGRIATQTGDSRWISNERSRRFVHNLRCISDAILVGIGTALSDDPQLTARIRRAPVCRQPIRIVLDTALRLRPESKLAKTAKDVPVWVFCGSEASSAGESELKKTGVEVIRLPLKDGRVEILPVLKELGRRNVTSLLVEGGSNVLGSFLEERLADEFYFFYAPKILADPKGIPMIRGATRQMMSEALEVHDVKVRRFGQDVLLSGRFTEKIF